MDTSTNELAKAAKTFQEEYLKIMNEQLNAVTSFHEKVQELRHRIESQSRTVFRKTWEPLGALEWHYKAAIKITAREIDNISYEDLNFVYVESDSECSMSPTTGLRKRSRSRNLDEVGTSDGDFPYSVKKRCLKWHKQRGVKDVRGGPGVEADSDVEETVLPSVEVDAKAEETIKSPLESNELNHISEGSKSSKRTIEKVDLTESTSMPHINKKSKVPTKLKVESQMPDPSTGASVEATSRDVDHKPNPSADIEYEDISAEVEARVKSSEDRRRNERNGASKPAPKRKRGSEGQAPKRVSLGRAAKAARKA